MPPRRTQPATANAPNRGLGRWLSVDFLPTTLFSLRLTHAISKGGKTNLIPTPYSVKMALIDACFRFDPHSGPLDHAHQIFDLIKRREVRVRPPDHCVVQNTFVRVLDSARDGDLPFKRTIAYREFVQHQGTLTLALAVAGCTPEQEQSLLQLFAHVNYLGKRGGFLQFLEARFVDGDLPAGFTAPITGLEALSPGIVRPMDDFGEALCAARDGFDRISTYGSRPLNLSEHRVLIPTLIPCLQVQAARGFTWYRSASRGKA